MAEPSMPTIADLPNHVLVQKILDQLSMKDRAAGASLVNKEWRNLVKQCRHQPKHLMLRPEDFSPSFMTWHLTDTARLRHVGTRPLRPDRSDAELYEMFGKKEFQESMERLLSHLAGDAPALGSMEINPTALCRDPADFLHRSMLPWLGALGQLQSLVLKNWHYTWSDFEHMHLLTSLQNLQSLELVNLRATAQPGSRLRSSQVAEWAGRALQHVLPTLAALTRLHLVDLDCCNVLPWGDRALTNLKSLVHDLTDRGASIMEAPADVYSIEWMTGLEQLWMCAPEEEPMSLTHLARLKELTYTNSPDLQHVPLCISPDAVLTKLALHGYWDRDFDAVFPLDTLRNVRELTLDCCVYEPRVLPASWSHLTDLTSLSLSLACNRRNRDHLLSMSAPPKCRLREPLLGADLSHLENLEVALELEEFLGTGLQTVEWLLAYTPCLTRLAINVHNLTEGRCTEVEAVAQLQEACFAIKLELAELCCIVPAVTESCSSTARLVLTIDQHAEASMEELMRVPAFVAAATGFR